MSKRLFDWVMSSLGLLALGPLLILIALVVKLDSPGPVFFRQERVGRFGVPFRIHKFRTMRHDPAGSGLQITVGADRRITRVGQFLRGSKLDELPQLIDVWQGTMSLVGPRPEVPRYVAHYPAALARQAVGAPGHHRHRLDRIPRQGAVRRPRAGLHRRPHKLASPTSADSRSIVRSG
jgi:lipopolysaccharide/colanic/teichoic acid biosynthesis glycosyltransferase